MNGLHVEMLRKLYPRVLAKTMGLTKSLPDAEDAVQDAIERALEIWPVQGSPDSPEAWLLTVAGNRHRDRLRRSRREEPREVALDALAQVSPWVPLAVGESDMARGWKDELLRLLFTCCHPTLEVGESAALALATVLGLSTSEIAHAFLVAPRSMEQRLTRARQRLRERGSYDGVRPEDAPNRLDAVLRTLYLLFNEGYWAAEGDSPIRGELCRLAVGLGRSLFDAFPSDPEVAGFLALLLLHDARRDARLDEGGTPVPLPDQDRTRWDRGGIAEAVTLLERALRMEKPGPFQIEAAISAVHCGARRSEETDWREIACLYALLESFRRTPAVRVNRAFAVARADGPLAGLALLGRDEDIATADYPYVHLVRGTLLGELGRADEARASLELAMARARNASERDQIRARIDRLGSVTSVHPAPHDGELDQEQVG
jgi:RNA polymerase sigma-70 factor (ECF subfamily)